MAGLRKCGAIGVVIAGSMIFGSTGAIAASAPAAQYDPWAVLSVMSGGASAAAVCGVVASTGVTAAQPGGGCVLPQVDVAPPPAQTAPPQPIPVPPVEGPSAGLGISPMLLGLAAIAAALGLYLILHHNHGNSPA